MKVATKPVTSWNMARILSRFVGKALPASTIVTSASAVRCKRNGAGAARFRLLSRLSLRQLDPVADRQAWNEPAAWLEQQMILDLDGVAGTLRELADGQVVVVGERQLVVTRGGGASVVRHRGPSDREAWERRTPRP
jgi:hypothetical protein